MFVRRFRALLTSAAALVLCALFLLPMVSAAADTPVRRTVRVGLPDTDTVLSSGSDNRTVAFQKDYIQAVAQYAGWDCVFVAAPWAECLDMVKSGELDILMDVSKTDERLEYYNYSSESMGTEMCYLFGRSDTDLQYGDVGSFNGMTVGYESGSTILDSLTEYAAAAGFTFTARQYESGAAMFAALDSGEVDTVVQTNFYDTPAGHVILGKFDPSPVYIVTSKSDPTLKTELDSAMALLFSYSPSFNTDIFKYHFGNTYSITLGYTQDELDYLASNPVVYVLYETNWAPFEYDQNGTAEGITPDILRAIGQDTGIDFQFVLASSTQAVYEIVGGSSADTVMAVSYDYAWADSHDLLVTQPYITGSVVRVTKGTDTTPVNVAVVTGGYLANQISKTYPELEPVEYQTFGECMEAVAKGDADCTFLNYYQASYYRSAGSYEDFNYQPDENITQGIGLGVTRESNPVLFSILSKSLQHLTSSQVQTILSENSAQTAPLTIRGMLRRYPAQMAAGIGLAGALIGFLIVLGASSRVRKRQNIQLSAAKQAADSANRAKSEFLSRMSHDMRTPLNGIIGMTYLTEKLDLPQAARDNLSKIDTSSRFLLSLINDLLDMTKAESGKIELHPEPYSPEEFRQYLDAVIRPLCEGKNQTFAVDVSIPDGFVPLVDKLRFNQIVFNLLSNAVKYTPEGGTVSYLTRASAEPGSRLCLHIQVVDNGIGMSREFQKVLFTPFSQEGRNDNSESRGSGLGLAITKRLVDLMGGTIFVESEVGRGTAITVDLETDCTRSLPCPAAGDAPAADDDGHILAGAHVLLCEDHPLNQEIAQALLREKQIAVELADDGQRGVDVFSHSPVGYFDAILMDIRMPVMDGYAAARAIRALSRPDAGTVPIFAMSADVLTDDVQKCLRAGMDGHIAKPIDPRTMYRELAAAIRRSRAHEAPNASEEK